MRRMAVASTCAALWRSRSRSVIWWRCSRVLRSSAIGKGSRSYEREHAFARTRMRFACGARVSQPVLLRVEGADGKKVGLRVLFLHQRAEFRDDVRVLIGDVLALADVLREIEKLHGAAGAFRFRTTVEFF